MKPGRSDITLSAYVERRNGIQLGARGSMTAMLNRSLGADTPAGFWRHWNPIWGFYLSRYVNTPLRRFLPPALAVIGTFVVSGAIHDVAITAVRRSPTFLFLPWFGIVGVTVVLGSRLRLRYGFTAWSVRAAINVAFVAGALVLALIGKQLPGLF